MGRVRAGVYLWAAALPLLLVTGVQAAPLAGAARPAGAPTYLWPEFHLDNSLDGVTADPAISTASAPALGVQWMANTGAQILSSPMADYNATLGETLVFAGNEAGYEMAFNQATGVPVWSANLGSPIRSSPLAENGNLWVEPSKSYRLYKLNAATGAVECSAPTPNYLGVDSSPMLATPPGGSPTVYIGVNDAGPTNGPVVGVDEADCAVDFSSTPEPEAGTGGVWDPIGYGVSATGEGLVFFGTADPDSAVYAIDAVTGALVWRYAVDNPSPGTYDVGAGVTVSAPGVNGFADGVVYVPSKYGIMYALDLTTGALVWQYNFGAVSRIVPPGSLSTAALDGTQLVWGNAGGVSSVNAVTGAPQWHYSDGNTIDVDASPVISGPAGSQVVSFTTQTGQLQVVSLATGALLYSYQTANYMVSSPAEANGSLIVTSGDGYVYDFAPGGGNGPAPTTTVSAPAGGASLPNPGSHTVTISGSAADPGGSVTGVSVDVQEGGANGAWWDGATASWGAAPYPNPATLGTPGGASTTWSLPLPVVPQGNSYEIFASAVNSTGVADPSAGQGAPTPARVNFSVKAGPPPHISLNVASAPLSTKVNVKGTGFAAGEKVKLTLGTTTLSTATATATGALGPVAVTVPNSTPFGPDVITATGQTSGKVSTATLYVADPWNIAGESATHVGADVPDGAFNNHLSVAPSNYLSQSWSFNTGAAVTAGPSVVNGIAYVANAAGDVYAVGVGTGTQLWMTNVAAAAVETTPAVDNGTLFVGTDAGTVVALNAKTGAPMFSTTLDGSPVAGSPTPMAGIVYVTTAAGIVYALNWTTGAVEWQYQLPAASTSTPAVDGAAHVLVVGDDSGTVTALNPTTGALLWTFAATGQVKAAPMIYQGRVYVGSTGGTFYALSETAGTVDWTHAMSGPITAAASLVPGSPTSIGVGSSNQTVYLNPGVGSLIYAISMNSPVVGLGGAIGFEVSLLSNGTIIGSQPQQTDPYAWQVPMAGGLASAPAVTDGAVYVAGKGGMLTCWTVPGHQPY